MVTPADILGFWFGPYETLSHLPSTNFAKWFRKDADFDAVVKSRFEEALTRAGTGEYDAWMEQGPESALALLILLDQFPRNIYRTSGQSFAYDSKARRVVESMLSRGWERVIDTPGRMFLSVALEHQEDMQAQRLAQEVADACAAEAPLEHRKLATDFLPYPRKHAEIIERFGRFPHRNALLGRESTAEELEFLVNFPGF